MNIHSQIIKANAAAASLALVPTARKNKAIRRIAELILKEKKSILSANRRDLEEGRQKGLGAKLDRLMLNEDRLEGIAAESRHVAKLSDSVGAIIDERVRPNGLKIARVRVPIGVVAIIYESRPNVTVDASVLCLKSGNAVILKGGSDAIHSNRVLTQLIRRGLEESGIDPEAVQFIDSTDRRATQELLSVEKGIDCVIPRGGKGLIAAVKKCSCIPVIETGASVVHVYVDKKADFKKAVDIAVNSKIRRVSICNSMDVLLVHRGVATKFLPLLGRALGKETGNRKQETAGDRKQETVEIRADRATQKLFGGYSNLRDISEADFDTEFLDYIMAVKIVGSLEEATRHIREHSLKHSESIVTEDKKAAEKFLKSVDAACVYHNASTQFSDGAQFGLGAEIGISTQKLHVRGPFALEGLTTYKWVIRGDGQIRP